MNRFASLAAFLLASAASAVCAHATLSPAELRRQPHRQPRQVSASTFPASTALSSPATSFDRYANGGWRARTEIPADRSSIGSFLTAALLVEQRNVDIIGGASREESGGRDERAPHRRLLCRLSRPRHDRPRGTSPLQPQLQRIQAIANRRDLSAALGASMRADVDPLNATSFGTENLSRRLRRPGPAGAEPQFRLSAAGRARPAGPRLLPLRRRRR